MSETFLLHKNMCDKMIVSRFASKNALSPISCGFEANIFMASKRVHFAWQHFLPYKTIKSHALLLLFLKIVLSLIFKSRRPHLSDRIALFVFALSFWRLQAAES